MRSELVGRESPKWGKGLITIFVCFCLLFLIRRSMYVLVYRLYFWPAVPPYGDSMADVKRYELKPEYRQVQRWGPRVEEPKKQSNICGGKGTAFTYMRSEQVQDINNVSVSVWSQLSIMYPFYSRGWRLAYGVSSSGLSKERAGKGHLGRYSPTQIRN
jgi:hypothetical protein